MLLVGARMNLRFYTRETLQESMRCFFDYERGTFSMEDKMNDSLLSEGNVVRVEALKELTIMVAAPGATRDNTTVHTDVGSDGNGGGTIHLSVGKPDVSEDLQERVDLSFDVTHTVPSQYDLKTIKVGIKDGLIFMKIKASKDRISAVVIDEE